MYAVDNHHFWHQLSKVYIHESQRIYPCLVIAITGNNMCLNFCGRKEGGNKGRKKGSRKQIL